MGQEIYTIPRITDEQIHRALVELSKEFGQLKVSMYIGQETIGEIIYLGETEAQRTPAAQLIQTKMDQALSLKSELITRFIASIKTVSIEYIRGGGAENGGSKSPVFDNLKIDPKTFDFERIKIAAKTIALFRPVQLPNPADPITLLESQRALQESSFSRLEMQLEKVFEQTIDLTSQLNEQARINRDELEQEFKQKTLEANQQLEMQVDDIAGRERDLAEKRKSLDESDNTFARREIRDRMLSDVAARVKNFGLSETTVKARKPVRSGIFSLCFFLIIGLMGTSYELYTVRGNPTLATWSEPKSAIANRAFELAPHQATAMAESGIFGAASAREVNTTERILLWLRFAFLSIGLAASILYYIRWENAWATSFATTEQSLQQFHIDVNRANWVVETCLEWRKETTSDLPAPLIESLTKGLFAGRDTSATVLHPADELASALMGSASKLSLDINGNKLDIDKPGKISKVVTTGASSLRQGTA